MTACSALSAHLQRSNSDQTAIKQRSWLHAKMGVLMRPSYVNKTSQEQRFSSALDTPFPPLRRFIDT
jgi:hypothetical protein